MLYLVVVTPNPGVGIPQIEQRLQPADSWYRLSPSTWIICSGEVANVWSARLQPLVAPNNRVYVRRLLATGDAQGWMAPDFWNWLGEHPP